MFTNVLLLDELNRIGPKTQSALMEVLVEGQVTLDRSSFPLPDPFFVIATQNPLDPRRHLPPAGEPAGPLRLRPAPGLPPPPAAERLVFRGEAGSGRLEALVPAMDLAGWRQARALVRQVHLADALHGLPGADGGADPQGQGVLLHPPPPGTGWPWPRAESWLDARDFVTPDDLQATLGDVMAHRGTMEGRRLNRDDRREQLARLLGEVPVGWKG